jgi:hypothetical protein
MTKGLLVWCGVLLLVGGLSATPRLEAQTASVEIPPWQIPLGSSKGIAKAILTAPDCQPELRVELVLGPRSPLMTDGKAREDFAKLIAHNAKGRWCPETPAARITIRAESGATLAEYVLDLSPQSLVPDSSADAGAGSTAADAQSDPPPPDDAVPGRVHVDVPGLGDPGRDFGLAFWAEIAFASFVGLLVLGIHLISEARDTDAMLQAPSSIRKILFSVLRGATLLTPRGGKNLDRMIVEGSSDLATRFTVPATRGIFWHEDRLESCWLAYVPVAPGTIARVEAKMASQSPILDTSRAVTVLDNIKGGRLNVTSLERGVRWQITSTRGIDTQDGYAVRLHLAVHSWIDAPADDPCLTTLFQEHSAYTRDVRAWALRTLEELLAQRKYEVALRFGDNLIDELNQRWQQTEDHTLGAKLAKAICTRFTAILIKPRQEGEHTRFKDIFSNVAWIEDQTNQLKEKNQNLIRELQQEVFTHYGNMSSALAALLDPKPKATQRFPRIPPGGSQFRQSVRKRTEQIGGTLSKGMDDEIVKQVVSRPFLFGKQQLEHNAAEYINACSKLAAAVRRLRREQKRTMEKLKR